MRVLLLAAGTTLILSAAVVDRVAIVVGNNVITETELGREVRLTEFLNGEPLDLSPAKRRAAAERLVDQQLIRNELELSHYQQPGPAEADKVLREFRREHYPDDQQFQAALAKYGISEDDLKQLLTWQVTAMQFTESRFRSTLPGSNVQTANRLKMDSESTANRTRTDAEPTDENTVDQQMDAWLKEARGNTRVQFKPEAFQ
jgi:hypothetical protein